MSFFAANNLYISDSSRGKDVGTNISCSYCRMNSSKHEPQTLERLKSTKVKTHGCCSSLQCVSRAVTCAKISSTNSVQWELTWSITILKDCRKGNAQVKQLLELAMRYFSVLNFILNYK